jgi:hypothetical protein
MLQVDISNNEYHSRPELGRSTAFDMLRTCPKLVRHKQQTTKTDAPHFVIGGAFHTATLEAYKLDEEYAVKPSEIDGQSSRTNHYKEAFGLIEKSNPQKRWLSPSDWDKVIEMSEEAKEHPFLESYLSEPDKIIEGTGFFELMGAKCKVRPDYYCPSDGTIIDLKSTTDASPKEFKRSVHKYGYAFQAAWYLHGLRLCGEDPKRFIFFAVEKTPPYLTGIYEISNEDVDKYIPMMEEACVKWAKCVESGVWEGYPDSVQILDMSNKFIQGKMSITKLSKHFRMSRNTISKYIVGLNKQIVGRETLYDINEVTKAITDGKKNKRKSKRKSV